MAKEITAEWVRAAAKKAGADLVGITSIDRFSGEKPENHPASIFPECKSVIVVGRRVLRGAIRGVEEGTNFNSTYGCFGYNWLEDNFLSQTTYDLTIAVEGQGFEAVPLFGYSPDGMPTGFRVAPDKPEPNVIVNLEVAAQAAGLAEIGLGGFMITEEFGTRQRFATILTDAELAPDPIRTKSLCADCGACAKACPFGAIHVEKKKKVGVSGHEMAVAVVDYDACRRCPNGAMLGKGRGSRPDRIAAACGRACLVQLEKAGKCKNSFAQPFRKRSPWALDMLQRPVEMRSEESPAQLGCGKNVDYIGQTV